MSQPTRFARAARLQALFLAELDGRLDATAPLALGGPEGAAEVQAWREHAFLTHEDLTHKLEASGLDEDRLGALLASRRALLVAARESPPSSEGASGAFAPPPEWERTLTAVFARRPTDSDDPAPHFRPALRRFVDWALDEIGGLTRAGGPPIDEERVRTDIGAYIAAALQAVCEPTLVLELNVARLENRLRGDTPQERFRFFCHEVLGQDGRKDGWRRLLEEYPVLARLLAVRLERLVAEVRDLLSRLASDWAAVASTLLGRDDVRLTGLRGGLSDPHGGGRTVWILTFSGERALPPVDLLQLVYKPRSLAVDRCFAGLVAWFNARTSSPPLRVARVVDRGDYGFAELIATAPCADQAAVRRFYRRQGALLALLHQAGATDIHHENIIAAGEEPIPIDLETLFHADLYRPPGDDAASVARRLLDASVLRVGLLPGWAGAHGGRGGVDVSGLGGEAGQMSPQELPTWEGAASDEMRAVYRRQPLAPGRNLPCVAGRPVGAAAHVDDIAAGYDQAYRLMAAARDELGSDDGPLAAFAEAPTRAIARTTALYGELLADGVHPDNLRDALCRERLLDLLWVWSGNEIERSLVPFEQDELRLGDVPRFVARPASRQLWTSMGQPTPLSLPESPLRAACRRIQALSDSDRAWQLWLIRAAVANAGSGHVPAGPGVAPAGRRRPRPRPPRLLALARRMGDLLLDAAIDGSGDTTWIGLKYLNDEQWQLGPVGPDLYDGDAGIALFLAHLGERTGDRRYTEKARRALASARATLSTSIEEGPGGGYVGRLSRLYAIDRCARLWQEPSDDVVEDQISRLAADARQPAVDVVAGLAGAIACCLALHGGRSEREGALAAALECAERLDERATSCGSARVWTPDPTRPALLGFSHGAAGIAWSLLALARAVRGHPRWGDRAARFRRLAEDALAYERARFAPARGNWPDLRGAGAPGGGPAFSVAWCHGAPGIALGRTLTLDMLDDESARAEIEVAVKTTFDLGLGLTHTLCHGDLGNLIIADVCARRLARPDWQARVARELGRVVDELETGDPRCGTASPAAAPGLLNGLAGIGYGLLYLAWPDELPLVLALA